MARIFDLKKILAPVGGIISKLEKRRGQLAAELQQVEGEISRLSGRTSRKRNLSLEHANGAPARRSKRVRRKREDLEALAQKIIEFIGSKGKVGASGGEIKAEFGSLLPSVNAWLKEYSKAKFKTTGAKSKTRYFV
jgi:hypothetical protein